MGIVGPSTVLRPRHPPLLREPLFLERDGTTPNRHVTVQLPEPVEGVHSASTSSADGDVNAYIATFQLK